MKFLVRNIPKINTLVVFLAFLFPYIAYASTYPVKNINVDVTAETALKAREEALDKAKFAAFSRLLKSIVLREDQYKIPEIAADEITDFINTYSIENEKLTGTRYLASYRFVFNKDQVDQFLTSYNISPAAYDPKKILIIPLFTNAEDILLLESFWRKNWGIVVSENKEDYLLPLFDIEDQHKIKTFITENKNSVLKEMLHKYGADTVIISWLKAKPEEENLYKADTYVLDEQDTIPGHYADPSFLMLDEDSETQIKIHTILDGFQESEKYKKIDQENFQREVLVEVPCTNIECVNNIKNDLYSIKKVKEVTVFEIDNEKVIFNTLYEGKFKFLQNHLNRMMYNVVITDTGIIINKELENKNDHS